jgi:hypothetical protein
VPQTTFPPGGTIANSNCLRAELDALYAYLYGLTREELDYILDASSIAQRKDEERYGEYRTKRLVLENYERLEPLMH